MEREENPFESADGAAAWIQLVENEKGKLRDTHIYPLLKDWVSDISIKTVLDIGGGQGVASQFCVNKAYTNVEPSEELVARAMKIFPTHATHVVGNAYELPFDANSFDAAFSINVWFHLKDLFGASKELARVLKRDGHFLIINPNPNAYDLWRTFYSDIEDIDEKTFVGKAMVSHGVLPRNTFYKHSAEEIVEALIFAGLTLDAMAEFAPLAEPTLESPDVPNLFMYYMGQKI